jgi:hypothetical protein
MPRSLVTAFAAVVVIVGAALIAQVADAAYTVNVRNETLRVTGNAASDTLALHVRPGVLEVDVRDDGSADFEVARDSFERIRVRAGGDDVACLGVGHDRFVWDPCDGCEVRTDHRRLRTPGEFPQGR